MQALAGGDARLLSSVDVPRRAHLPMPPGSLDFLSLVTEANRGRLLAGSTQGTFPPGSIVIRPDGPPAAYLLETGLARTYWNVPDGRQATMAFAHPTELVGVTSITGEPPWLFLQVITESRMTILDINAVRKLAATDVEVSTAVGAHLLRRLREAYRLIAVRTLGNIKERVAYDLLDRAAQSQLVVGRLEVRATQADLADSVGSSREVMSRALRELRVEGIVETAPGAIRVLDPTRLAAIVRAFVI
jgi:CRP/FNR family transcriptional regulator, cyclic AMP receptor protein